MSDISIQLHAVPNELLDFAQEISNKHDLIVIAIQLFPFKTEAVTSKQLDRLHEMYPTHERFLFTLRAPNLVAKGWRDLLDKNPDCLRLDIGRLTDDGLGESWFVARTNDTSSFDIWLEGGSVPHEGNIMIRMPNGFVGPVCDDTFTIENEGGLTKVTYFSRKI